MAATMSYPMTHQGVRDLDHPRRMRKNSWVNVGSNERILSGIGGAALAACGLKQGGLLGMMMDVAAGLFMYRAVTGHCGAYATLGINTAQN
jgi:uncharacterized membrane protein